MRQALYNISSVALGTLPGSPNELEVLVNPIFLLENDRVLWVGPAENAPQGWREECEEVHDLKGRAVLPGFVESHTHLVFAGSRAHEFSLRCAGATYEEIGRSGGGIRYTAQCVRQASEEELIEEAMPRLRALLNFGVTTVEIKSGYGLTLESELKMLRVIRALGERTPQRIVSTFLGAHVVPPEFRERKEAYVDLVVEEMLPAVAAENLADFCDVFCESGAFSVEDTRRILEEARRHGLGLKIHAEQLSASGATRLGAEMNVTSVDHCEWVTPQDIEALQHSDTVATLLPGATLFLGMSRWAPARTLLDAGIPVALSTDCNPGSSYTENIQLMANLGCTRLGMSAHESIAAITSAAALALGKQHEVGSLRVGYRADLAVLDSPVLEDLVYHFGANGVSRTMIGGKFIR